MNKKHTIEEVKKVFEDNGCELLEKTYKNNVQLLRYRCKCGRLGVINFKNFADRKHCKLCSLKNKYASVREKVQNKKLSEMENLFTMGEAAEIVGIKKGAFYDMVRLTKIVPAPERTSSFSATKQREYYSEEDIEKVKEALLNIVNIVTVE